MKEKHKSFNFKCASNLKSERRGRDARTSKWLRTKNATESSVSVVKITTTCEELSGASQWSGDRLFFPLSMNAAGRAVSSALWFRPRTALCFMRSREPPQKTRTPINYALTHSDSPIIYTIVIYCFFLRFGIAWLFLWQVHLIFFWWLSTYIFLP